MSSRFSIRLLKLFFISLPLLLASVYVQYSAASTEIISESAAHHGEIFEGIFGARSPELAFAGPIYTSPLLNAPAQVGLWAQTKSMPSIMLHMVMLRDGRILFWDRENNFTSSMQYYYPSTGAVGRVALPTGSVFCAGQILLPNGKVMLVGGHLLQDDNGLVYTNIFDPIAETWSRAGDMTQPRWYPTLTELGDGHLVVMGGTMSRIHEPVLQDPIYSYLAEVFSHSTNTWTPLNNAPRVVGTYPRNFLMPTGNRILVITTDGVTAILDVDSESWSPNFSTNVPAGGNPGAVMYRPGKVIYTVGNSTSVMDLNQPNPAWRTVQNMAYSRYDHSMIALPDGNVLVIGGSSDGTDAHNSAVLAAEIWNPNTETWTQVAAMNQPRMYHSVGFLLPDASVLTAGGGRATPQDYFSSQIYYPPYFYKGARPVITSLGATNVTRGGALRINTAQAASITSVALIGMPAATHALNVSQTYVPLTFTRGAGFLNAQIPGTPNTLPPNTYMVFIVNNKGVPSVAKFVQVN